MLKKEIREPRSCCNFRIVDWWGEPFIIIGGIAALTGLVYAAVTAVTIITVVSVISLVGTGIAHRRVRVLSTAKHLMDSVDDLKKENGKLKDSIVEFKSENKKFEGIVGLLDNDVKDISKVKEQLFNIYEGYEVENSRYEGNNLLSLFKLVDKNNDTNLSPDEMEKMARYTKIFYGHEFNFNEFDKNQDGTVSMEEFVNSIKSQRQQQIQARRLDLV